MGALPLPTPLPAQPAETSRDRHASTARTVLNISISWMANSPYCTSGITPLLPVKPRVLREKLRSLVLKRHSDIHRLSTGSVSDRQVEWRRPNPIADGVWLCAEELR